MNNKLIPLLLAASSLLLCSCATPTDQSTLAHIGVSYAVVKVVKNNPARAARVIAISSAVRAIAGSEAFNTVDLLDAYIRTRVDWTKLEPEDALLANLLLDEIKAALRQKVGGGVLTPDKLLVVAELAGWIESAAKSAAPTLPK